MNIHTVLPSLWGFGDVLGCLGFLTYMRIIWLRMGKIQRTLPHPPCVYGLSSRHYNLMNNGFFNRRQLNMLFNLLDIQLSPAKIGYYSSSLRRNHTSIPKKEQQKRERERSTKIMATFIYIYIYILIEIVYHFFYLNKIKHLSSINEIFFVIW